ncbi:hypothetical protein OHW85_13035 [Acinetobacter baumannii]|nr:hypothetical protein [Acinetobacter baumannii]
MTIRSEIESYLYSIESYLEDIKILEDPEHSGLVSDTAYEALEKFRGFKSQFEMYNLFIDKSSFSSIKQKLKIIINNLTELDNRGVRSQEESLSIASSTIIALKSLPDLRQEKFNFNSEITIDDLVKLLPEISEKSNIVSELNITNILKELPDKYFEETAKNLIELHNTLNVSNVPDFTILNHCYEYFANLKKNIELEQLDKRISAARDTLIEVKAETGKTSNKKLGEIFDTESEALKCKIRLYTSLIITIFLSLICFLAFFIYYFAVSNNGKFPSDNHFYYFYISLILIISGFLTFMIKERTRLVNHAHYCKISYLEICALSDYCSELEDKSKIDDLKIKLADRYFRGPISTSEASPDINNVSLITSKLSEISKAVQELKSAVK